MTIEPITLACSLVGLFILMIGVGIAVPKAVLRQNAEAYRVRAEQEAEARKAEKERADRVEAEIREEITKVKADHKDLKADHEQLKDKYIELLEENRNRLAGLCREMHASMAQILAAVQRT